MANQNRVTLESLDERLGNVERLLLSLQAQMAPKWLRVGGWATIIGTCLGALAKELVK